METIINHLNEKIQRNEISNFEIAEYTYFPGGIKTFYVYVDGNNIAKINNVDTLNKEQFLKYLDIK